jgi:hypothetical protein
VSGGDGALPSPSTPCRSSQAESGNGGCSPREGGASDRRSGACEALASRRSRRRPRPILSGAVAAVAEEACDGPCPVRFSVDRSYWRRFHSGGEGWSTPASRRPSRDVGDGDPEASDACVHSVPRSTSTRALLRREGTAARDRRPHRSVGAPAGPEGRGNDPTAFRYIPKIVLM